MPHFMSRSSDARMAMGDSPLRIRVWAQERIVASGPQMKASVRAQSDSRPGQRLGDEADLIAPARSDHVDHAVQLDRLQPGPLLLLAPEQGIGRERAPEITTARR